MTPEFLEAALDGRLDEAARLIGLELPEDFPGEGAKGFFAMRLKLARAESGSSRCACARCARTRGFGSGART